MSTIEFTESSKSSEQSLPESVEGAAEPGDAAVAGLRILLAEDSLINRQLVIHLLENRGHTVVVAENGREAVVALEQRRFDVVLMDVQMPVMTGFEATALIREKENGSSAHIPMIALTAHVMPGDRERCLEAGFDGYISKPIRPKELFKAIDDAMSDSQFGDGHRDEARATEVFANDEEQLDLVELLATVNGNPVLLFKLVSLFLKHYPGTLAELREAFNQGEGERLARAAHTLRGGAGSFLTGSARTALLSLEGMGRNGTTSHGETTLAQLEIEMARIEIMLAGFVAAAVQ